jgi:predicted transcriptional regulator
VRDWSFFSNHGLTLLCLARDPDLRIRDVAVEVGVTERAAHRLISDLVEGGYVVRERVGRRNRYQIDHEVAMRHPLVREHWIGELLAVLTGVPARRGAG